MQFPWPYKLALNRNSRGGESKPSPHGVSLTECKQRANRHALLRSQAATLVASARRFGRSRFWVLYACASGNNPVAMQLQRCRRRCRHRLWQNPSICCPAGRDSSAGLLVSSQTPSGPFLVYYCLPFICLLSLCSVSQEEVKQWKNLVCCYKNFRSNAKFSILGCFDSWSWGIAFESLSLFNVFAFRLIEYCFMGCYLWVLFTWAFKLPLFYSWGCFVVFYSRCKEFLAFFL